MGAADWARLGYLGRCATMHCPSRTFVSRRLNSCTRLTFSCIRVYKTLLLAQSQRVLQSFSNAMYLVKVDHEGNLSLVSFLPGNTPLYAIFSDTWRPEEVTCQDMRLETGRNKAGFHRVRLCASKTWRDGLEFFWVYSCCAKKTNSEDLNEAAQSMFRWFAEAVTCYAWLADV